jgi:hypothetical protein
MTTDVFNISNNKERVTCPPEQVFLKSDFSYMITIGGHLVDDEVMYQNLMRCLEIIGEKDFFILENWGTSVTDREAPFFAKIPTASDLAYFDSVVNKFDDVFGLMPYHFFVYGRNDKWGIYLCECPTINIIGCTPEYADDFREVFGIVGNGFKQEEEFIAREYQTMPHLKTQFIENYKLKG